MCHTPPAVTDKHAQLHTEVSHTRRRTPPAVTDKHAHREYAHETLSDRLCHSRKLSAFLYHRTGTFVVHLLTTTEVAMYLGCMRVERSCGWCMHHLGCPHAASSCLPNLPLIRGAVAPLAVCSYGTIVSLSCDVKFTNMLKTIKNGCLPVGSPLAELARGSSSDGSQTHLPGHP